MDIGILGTGDVGKQLGRGLVKAGHRVRLGSRTAEHEGAAAWVAEVGQAGSHGTFADAAAFGEIVLNCLPGQHALAGLAAAGSENLSDKVLIDVSNPLDFSQGFPPRLFTHDESLAEQIQAALPDTRVVKALNTVANDLMIEPGLLAQATDLPICGDDEGARRVVAELLRDSLGWERIVDLGPLSNARGTEAWLLLWTRLMGTLGTHRFNLRIVTEDA